MKPRRRILILSGPTHEYIDPVRFIGNASSGRMGKAIAEQALANGFKVDFISGPVAEQNLPHGVNLYQVTGAEEMLEQATARFPHADITIFAAAVADYTPAEKHTEKMAKSSHELTLRLRPTPDIAQTLGTQKKPGQITIGFALQTSNGEACARRKLESKNLDAIVLNTPETLGADQGQFSFLTSPQNAFEHWGRIGKTRCAQNILKHVSAQSQSN